MFVYVNKPILINLCKRYDIDHQKLLTQSKLSSGSSRLSEGEQPKRVQTDEDDENDAKIDSRGIHIRKFFCKTCQAHYTTHKTLKEMQIDHNIFHSGHEIAEITHEDEQK